MRARLGLPGDALIVLTAFHMGSAFTRKNPLAAIAAFRRAFGDAPDRLLVIKLIDHGASPIARAALERAIAGASNIRLVNLMLPPADMSGLMAAVDIVLSLHRSEGFGLVPAEAMQLGKPVVATGWSGNMDFMNARNSAPVSYRLVPVQDPYDGAFIADGQLWADADVDDAADWLRRLAAEPAVAPASRRSRPRRHRAATFAGDPLREPSPNSSKPERRDVSTSSRLNASHADRINDRQAPHLLPLHGAARRDRGRHIGRGSFADFCVCPRPDAGAVFAVHFFCRARLFALSGRYRHGESAVRQSARPIPARQAASA